MAYVVRTKDQPGYVGRAADQQQSVDNESALYAAVLGAGPVATGGMVRQFVKLTGIADNTATTFATITTTNEAGNTDGGIFHCVFEGISAHGSANNSETSCMGIRTQFARAVNAAAAAGNNSAVVASSTTAVAASTGGTKTITTTVMTVVETSEYLQSLQITIDCAGAAVTTGEIYGMITLYYVGFLTPPVVTSIG
jgi:hypothetical protein